MAVFGRFLYSTPQRHSQVPRYAELFFVGFGARVKREVVLRPLVCFPRELSRNNGALFITRYSSDITKPSSAALVSELQCYINIIFSDRTGTRIIIM